MRALFLVSSLAGCQPEHVWFADHDGDGFGGPDDLVVAREAPVGFVGNDRDCNDADRAIHPEAVEVCNEGTDDDCDGLSDDQDPSLDPASARPFFRDDDQDGYGDVDKQVIACELPAGAVLSAADCDDLRPDVFPGAPEICNTVDDDCDALTDDADPDVDLSTGTTFFADQDADGAGDPAAPRDACTMPAGHAADGTDCAPNNPHIHPGATEICNDGVDDDCDKWADDVDPSLDLTTATMFYADEDGDGFGNLADRMVLCAQPEGYVPDNTDCAPLDAAVHPGAVEICNLGIDDDCSGAADDDDAGLDLSTASDWFEDADGDGFGSIDLPVTSCEQPAGWISDNSDCNDATDWINPSAPERCNEVDDDCDGATHGEGVWWFEPAGSTWSDETAGFESGNGGAPHLFTATESGTLFVCAGAYDVRVESLHADFALIGPDGPARTSLRTGSGSLPHAVVYHYGAGHTEVRGITVEQSDSSGVYVHGGSDLIATDLVIDDNATIGLYKGGGNLELADVTFTRNNRGFYPTGVVGTVQDVQIADNDQGVWASTADLVFERVLIVDNVGFADGAGVYAWGSTFEFVDCEISGNGTTRDGGGFYLKRNSDVTLIDTLVEANDADRGGGMFLDATNLGGVDVHCEGDTTGVYGLVSNVANDGGAVYALSQTTLHDDGTTTVYEVDLTALDCDFGTSASGDDNAPNDVVDERLTEDCTGPSGCTISASTTTTAHGNDATF